MRRLLVVTALGVLILNGAQARYVSPGLQPPSLRDVQVADAVLLVETTAPIPRDDAATRSLGKLPDRDAVYAGGKLEGKVLQVLKGTWGGSIEIPLGMHRLERERDKQGIVPKGARLVLFVRTREGKPWLSRYCSLKADAA